MRQASRSLALLFAGCLYALAQTPTSPSPTKPTPNQQSDSHPPSDDVLDLPTGEPAYVLNPQKGMHAERSGGIEVLSNTGGVDFGPYLRKLKLAVQKNWEPLVPETALPPIMKSGKVT